MWKRWKFTILWKRFHLFLRRTSLWVSHQNSTNASIPLYESLWISSFWEDSITWSSILVDGLFSLWPNQCMSRTFIKNPHFCPSKSPVPVESTAFPYGWDQLTVGAPLPDWLSFRPCQRAYPPLDPGGALTAWWLRWLVVCPLLVVAMPKKLLFELHHNLELLVGGWALPLWKMMEWKSVGMMTFPTEWKNNPNVPNHQPIIRIWRTWLWWAVYIYICICIYVYVYIYEHRSDDGIRGKFLSGFQLFSGILENALKTRGDHRSKWWIFACDRMVSRVANIFRSLCTLCFKKNISKSNQNWKGIPKYWEMIFLLPRLKRLFMRNLLVLSRSQHHLRLSQDSVWLSLRCLPHESCHKISYPPIMSFW